MRHNYGHKRGGCSMEHNVSTNNPLNLVFGNLGICRIGSAGVAEVLKLWGLTYYHIIDSQTWIVFCMHQIWDSNSIIPQPETGQPNHPLGPALTIVVCILQTINEPS